MLVKLYIVANQWKDATKKIRFSTSPNVFNVYDTVRKAATLMEGVESEDWSCIENDSQVKIYHHIDKMGNRNKSKG